MHRGGVGAEDVEAAAMHDTFSSPNGWGGMLRHYAEVASARAAPGT